MAVGVDVIKTIGRLIFDLQRGAEETTRYIEISNPISNDDPNLQAAINRADSIFSSETDKMNLLMQPVNWRDTNVQEQQWVTKGVHYESIMTVTTPIEPDEVLSATMANEEQQQERDERGEQHEQEQQQNEGQPQGEWQG